MKKMKFTMAALAVIAAAAFTPSAFAAPTGDVILGIYDANSGSTSVAQSYEVDLGAFSKLTAGETFVLGTSISSVFGTDASAQLVFDIAATGAAGSGGLAAKEIALTADTLPPLPAHGGNTSPNTNIGTEDNVFGSGNATLIGTGISSTLTTFTEDKVANAVAGSFFSEVAASYGYGGGNPAVVLTPFTNLASADFYTIANKTTQEVATADGEFVFGLKNGLETLTFDPIAVAIPEPSTYTLGIVGVALLWVLKRRRSVA